MRAAALLLVVALTAPAAAQVTVPGGNQPSVTQERAMMDARMRAQVDALLGAWAAALAKHDAKRLERCYDDDAVLVLSSGGRANGPRAIVEAYRRLMPRFVAVSATGGKVVSNGVIGSVSADVRFSLALPGGGSYDTVLAVRFGWKSPGSGDYLITQQEGGDFLSLAVRAPAALFPGAVDTLRAIVSDATGAPVAGVVVRWNLEEGAGALAAGETRTDTQGAARVAFTKGTQPGRTIVRAVAEPLAHEPAFITIAAAP